jgi:hypothetical protein
MTNKTYTPLCPQGLEEFTFKIDGVDLTCHFEYEAPEQGSRENGIQMEPDYPGEITIHGIYAGNDVDIQSIISSDIVDEIEAHIRHEMESTNDYDY